MRRKPTLHNFVARPKRGKKAKTGQLKRVRKGARHPGAMTQGSTRRPF